MKTKKLISILIATVLAAGLLAGCGNEQGTPAVTETETTTTAATATEMTTAAVTTTEATTTAEITTTEVTTTETTTTAETTQAIILEVTKTKVDLLDNGFKFSSITFSDKTNNTTVSMFGDMDKWFENVKVISASSDKLVTELVVGDFGLFWFE